MLVKTTHCLAADLWWNHHQALSTCEVPQSCPSSPPELATYIKSKGRYTTSPIPTKDYTEIKSIPAPI